MKLPEPTPRLRFREMREEDAAFVLDMFSDEQAQRFHADISSLEIAGRWTAFMMKRQREQGHSLWMLESLDDGRPVGDCGLLLQEVEGAPVLEVGYHLHARERGRGFATEAARACLAHALAETDAPFVGSLVHPDNEPSARVAARVHAAERRVEWRGGPYRLFFTERGGP